VPVVPAVDHDLLSAVWAEAVLAEVTSTIRTSKELRIFDFIIHLRLRFYFLLKVYDSECAFCLGCKFEDFGITYRDVVQVKDWDGSVNKGEMLKFLKVPEDLPNQPRGIFVSRNGYQKGAREVAEAWHLNVQTPGSFQRQVRQGRLCFS